MTTNLICSIHKLLYSDWLKLDLTGYDWLQTIVHTLPCLTLVTEAEWLDPRLFSEMDPGWQVEGTHILLLRSQSEELKQSKPGAWRVKVSGKIHYVNRTKCDCFYHKIM